PGVTVFFDAGVTLTVNGQILAEGTDLARIRFTKYPSTTAWGQITIQNTQGNNRFTYFDQEYAGTTTYNFLVNTAQIDWDHVNWLNTTTHIIDIASSS